MQKFDVVVVGAGPAGSTAGMLLGKKFNTLLLDKAFFPRDKSCGGGLDVKAVKMLKRLGLLEKVKARAERIKGVKVFKGRQSFAGIAPKGEEENYGLCIERSVFDNLLLREAAKECKVIQGFCVESLILEGGCAVGVRGRDSKGRPKQFRARVVLCADGTFSVGHSVLPEKELHRNFAMRIIFSNVKGVKDFIEVHLFKEIKPGYLWVFPLKGNKVNCGLGFVAEKDPEKRVSFKKRFSELVDAHPHLSKRFAEAEFVAPPSGAKLPTSSVSRKIHSDGLVLLGDAAGLVDPLTGEGISNAMESAFAAAKAVEAAFQKNDFSERTLESYSKSLLPLRKDFKYALLVRRLLHSPLSSCIVKMVSGKKELRTIFAGVFAQEVRKKKLFKPGFLLRLFF